MSFCFGWFADNLLPKLRKSRKICNRVKTKKDVESSTSFCFVLLRKERDYCTWFVILVARRGAPAKFTPQKLINQLPFVSCHYACEKICPHNAVKQKKMSITRHLCASFFCGKRGSITYKIIENHKISIRCKLSVYKIVKFIKTHRAHFDI